MLKLFLRRTLASKLVLDKLGLDTLVMAGSWIFSRKGDGNGGDREDFFAEEIFPFEIT